MLRDFSVYGYWPHSAERWGEVFQATSARAAEDKARGEGGRLLVCAVFDGARQRADALYAKFADPDVRVA